MKELESNIPPVKGDQVQLGQVLLNLITNGCEAMGEAGSFLPCADCQDSNSDGRVCLRFGGRPRCWDFNRVAATGLRAIHWTKPLGLGLGLSICDWIVAAHGGKLFAENNPSGGAIFRFELPVASAGSEKWMPSRSSSSLTTTLPF